jgi:hypothetical protein
MIILVFLYNILRDRERRNFFVHCRSDLQMNPIIAGWEICPLAPSLRKSHNVDGMDEFHRADIEIHLVFFEDVLRAPSLESEFPRVSLRVLFDLAAVRPQELLDPVRIVLVGGNRHRLDDRIELDPGIELLCNLAANTVVLQGDFFGPCGENVLLIRVHCLAIRLERMIYAETSYQSVADLVIGFYPHIAVIE